ncbi:MAG: polyphosphate kinase 2 [Proteobacteria bacterium]|jgi:polyphosphate kinase 2|nr:polyphosphate kinase 2 [Pseudomonadota bacterium]MDA0857549.1 polyphosphate kinase 2 [Pseudomonadota bacterium]
MGKKADKKKEQRGQQDVAKAAKKPDTPPTVEEVPRIDVHIKHERLNKSFYESELVRLQLELVKWQTWIKQKGLKVVMLFEGRDAAGKGGVIKRITEPLNPRGCRVVALGTPTEKEKTQWYFQRYVRELPAAGEIVIFDRSWYNRAGVERVMGFCTDEQYEEFQRSCPEFERMLIRSGIILLKYWFSVSDEEQERRFHDRAKDPGKRWKLSPMDMESISRWVEYSKAKDTMLNFSNIPEAPWFGVEGDDKRRARLNCIHHVLSKVDYKDVLPSVIKIPERPPLPKDYQRPPREEQFHVPEVY